MKIWYEMAWGYEGPYSAPSEIGNSNQYEDAGYDLVPDEEEETVENDPNEG